MRNLFPILLLLSLLMPVRGHNPPPDTPPAGTETRLTSKESEQVKAEHRARAKVFLARYPPIAGVISTRIGNSSGGTTEETPGVGYPREFPGGAPMRLAIPLAVKAVGLEWRSLDRTKEPLIRIKSGWNEGGWHDTYVTLDGKVLGGTFDTPFPRTDYKNRTPENAWQFGTGWWINGGLGSESRDTNNGEYRGHVPFVELKRGKKIGDDSGVPGYSWVHDDSGFVLKTPKTTIYSLVTIGGAVADPDDPNLLFTNANSHMMNWQYKGGGREHREWKVSFDFEKYPTDPRKGGGAGHQQPIGAVRAHGTPYWFTSNTDINVYRWDESGRVMVPVASAALRPDSVNRNIAGSETPPKLEWGQGLITRADATGNLTAGRAALFRADKPFALWNGYQINVHEATGDIWFLPALTGTKDAKTAAVWKTFDSVRGILSPDNLQEVKLPTHLHSAAHCAQMRIHWETGDLYAIVERDGVYCLERYVGWRGDPGVKPVYSVGPVALSYRRAFEWWSPYDKETAAPYDPKHGFMAASHGTMAVKGDYAFMIEGQSQGIRIHRLRDGAYVGRYFDRRHQNSSQDDPNGVYVTETKTEYLVMVMDFHGKSALVRRIAKKDLK